MGCDLTLRRIGLISGPQPQAMMTYWSELHAEVRYRLGSPHTARLIIESLDVADIGDLTIVGERERASAVVCAAAGRLTAHGADVLLLCGSPLHLVARDVASRVGAPLLHMVEAVAVKLMELRLSAVAVVGLAGTDEEKMWEDGLMAHGIRPVIFPPRSDADFIATLLRRGVTRGVSPQARARFVQMSVQLEHAGAAAIVSTSPDLDRILPENDLAIPVVCAAQAHCEHGVRYALNEFECHEYE